MKITKLQLKQIIKEELEETLGEGHGGEGSMARSQLGRTAELAMMIQDMITDESDLEEWVESKITKAQDYLASVMNHMRGDELSRKAGGGLGGPLGKARFPSDKERQAAQAATGLPLAEAYTITDPSGEHARTYRSSEDEQKRYLRKAKQDAAALKRLKDTGPEEYERLVAKKQQDRESLRARSASNKDKVAIYKNIIQDLMDKGFSLEDAANSVSLNNPDAVAAAVAELKPEPE